MLAALVGRSVGGVKRNGRRSGGSGAREVWSCRLLSLGRSGRRLAGGIGKSAEGLGVAHGDVGQDLAVEVDAGELQAMDEGAVAQAVLARGGVDADDPQAAEVALAVAAVAVGVGIGLHDRFLGPLVVRVGLAAEPLRALERGAPLLLRVDGALDPRHLEPAPSSFLTRFSSSGLRISGLPRWRFRLADFFSRMWLVKECRPPTFPFAVRLKRFFAPAWGFIFGIADGAV